MTELTKIQTPLSSIATIVLSGAAISQSDRLALKELLKQHETKAPLPPQEGESGATFVPDRPDKFRFYSPDFGSGNHFVLLIADHGEDKRMMLGYCMIILVKASQKSYAILEDIIIDSRFRRHGLGQRLLRDALRWIIQQQQCFHVDVSIHPTRKASSKFLLKNGFDQVAQGIPEVRGTVNVFRNILVG